MKNLFLACTIMLGLQFFCPLVLKAGDHSQMAEMISLGAKDAETEVDASSVLEPSSVTLSQVQHMHLDAPRAEELVEEDRVSDALLPTAGRFPSAP